MSNIYLDMIVLKTLSVKKKILQCSLKKNIIKIT